MRAVVLESYGGPEVLTMRDVPDPEPAAEEVVVRIVSTALNRGDLVQRLGFYSGPPMAHEIPGMELAGFVVAAGERATRWAIGDAVMGIVGGGTYAESIAVHERQLMPVPPSVPVADAGAIPEVFLTAWDALLQGGITSGRVALVHAGASGVGTAAIQLVKALGARIIVTTSAGKVAACRDLGADLVVDYGSDDFVAAAKDFTGGAGVDLVLDVVGGDYLPRNLDALRIGGHIVQVGVLRFGDVAFPLAQLLPKRASITGTVLRGRPIEEKIALTQRFEREVLPFFADGTCQPVIDSRYALADIADAHRYMESNANVGKIVISVSAP